MFEFLFFLCSLAASHLGNVLGQLLFHLFLLHHNFEKFFRVLIHDEHSLTLLKEVFLELIGGDVLLHILLQVLLQDLLDGKALLGNRLENVVEELYEILRETCQGAVVYLLGNLLFHLISILVWEGEFSFRDHHVK